MKHSIYELTQNDFHKKQASIQYMNHINIARGIHISVREQDNPDIVLGHDKYSYWNTERELLWIRFQEPWSKTQSQGRT